MTGQALVTGAGKRLGREMALFLAGRGLDVAVHYHRSESEAAEVADLCRAVGVQAATLPGDLTDEDDMQSLVPRAVDALGGPLTVLVNSASVFLYRSKSVGFPGSIRFLIPCTAQVRCIAMAR